MAVSRVGLHHSLSQGTKVSIMFARKLYMYLKNDGALAFEQKIEGEVIPLLRQQIGIPRTNCLSLPKWQRG